MTYIDTYVSAPDKATLEGFASNFKSYLPVTRGQAESTDESGNVQPAKGNPEFWYTCVRANLDITALIASPLEKVSSDTGIAVCGVWM